MSIPIASSGTFRSPSFRDRKSTLLNSSHVEISYAVFCLKKKKAQLGLRTLHDLPEPPGATPRVAAPDRRLDGHLGIALYDPGQLRHRPVGRRPAREEAQSGDQSVSGGTAV